MAAPAAIGLPAGFDVAAADVGVVCSLIVVIVVPASTGPTRIPQATFPTTSLVKTRGRDSRSTCYDKYKCQFSFIGFGIFE